VEHKADCKAVQERADLTASLLRATEPVSGLRRQYIDADGSHEALSRAYGVLTGIVAEYSDDGDQMMEACTCADPYSTATGSIRTTISDALKHKGSMSDDEHKNLIAIEEFVRVRDNA
jgi:hypothetical protein